MIVTRSYGHFIMLQRGFLEGFHLLKDVTAGERRGCFPFLGGRWALQIGHHAGLRPSWGLPSRLSSLLRPSLAQRYELRMQRWASNVIAHEEVQLEWAVLSLNVSQVGLHITCTCWPCLLCAVFPKCQIIRNKQSIIKLHKPTQKEYNSFFIPTLISHHSRR